MRFLTGGMRTVELGSPRSPNHDGAVGCLLIPVFPLLMLISGFFAWHELKYAIFSKTALGTVKDISEVRGFHVAAGGKPMLRVTYRFFDTSVSELRTEDDEIPISWPRPEEHVAVAYLPGQRNESRIANHRNDVVVVLFTLSLIIPAIWIAFLYREARMAEQEAARNEKREQRRIRGD
jgi:hypothetical protein